MRPTLPDHARLTVDPEDLSITCPPQRHFAPNPEPTSLPPLRNNHDEPLVEVAHPRITYLAAYHRAGLPKATEFCLLRASTAERLYEAAGILPEGLGLAVFDGWRHPDLQAYLAAACPDPRYVTPPDDPATSPAPHTTGGAVDLTLTARGSALSLGTDFDHFGPEAAADAFEDLPGLIRDLRRMLRWVMVKAGFAPYSPEWWHFEYGTRRWGAHTGLEPRYGPASPSPL